MCRGKMIIDSINFGDICSSSDLPELGTYYCYPIQVDNKIHEVLKTITGDMFERHLGHPYIVVSQP